MTTYTAERFLSNCSKKIAKGLVAAWKNGDQLAADKVPKEALPAVLILAAWGQRINIDIVDDYETLIDRSREAFKTEGVNHPDLFFASSIVIMHDRGQELTVGSFETIGVPTLFEDFFDLGEVEDEPESAKEDSDESEEA